MLKMNKEEMKKYEKDIDKRCKEQVFITAKNEYIENGFMRNNSEEKSRGMEMAYTLMDDFHHVKEQIILDAGRVCMCPINLDKPGLTSTQIARAYYMYEKESIDGMRWDIISTKELELIDGDLFVFVNFRMNIAEIFRVREINSERRSHWMIQQHSERKVAILSERIGLSKWSDMCKILYEKDEEFALQGTALKKWNSEIPVWV